jgi:cobalt/nickel transport system permease protein
MDRARRMEIGLAARGYDGRFRTLAPAAPLSPSFVALSLATLTTLAGAGLWLS